MDETKKETGEIKTGKVNISMRKREKGESH